MTIKKLIEERIINKLNESTDEVLAHAGKGFAKIAKGHQKDVAQKTNSPAGPDTSKFTSTAHGYIAHKQHVTTFRGHGAMFQDRWHHFIQVGSNVDHKVKREITNKAVEHMNKHGLNFDKEKVNDGSHKIVHKGQSYTMSRQHGSSWGGVGIKHDGPASEYQLSQLKGEKNS